MQGLEQRWAASAVTDCARKKGRVPMTTPLARATRRRTPSPSGAKSALESFAPHERGTRPLDCHLPSLLQAHVREPAALLARKLKVPRTTVIARIARPEHDGVATGHGVWLGRALEEALVHAFCGLSVAALERLPEVEELSTVRGPFVDAP